MNCPVLLQYPDQIISNTKVVQSSSTNPDTPPTHVSDVHDTPGSISPPPPDTLSGNHPELAIHPRINFRSEQHASFYVRALLTIHLSCHALIAIACCVFIVSSPSFIAR